MTPVTETGAVPLRAVFVVPRVVPLARIMRKSPLGRPNVIGPWELRLSYPEHHVWLGGLRSREGTWPFEASEVGPGP